VGDIDFEETAEDVAEDWGAAFGAGWVVGWGDGHTAAWAGDEAVHGEGSGARVVEVRRRGAEAACSGNGTIKGFGI
jgi:hypothetical protein